MSTELIALSILMAAVTWPSRALPMLLPGIDRLPDAAHEYLRLIGPAILASLAAVSALVVVDPAGAASLHLGVEGLAVLVAVAVVAWRRNLLLALVAAVALVAIARALGLAA
ncbi:MAG: AzlD domain-containing protein [Chloroflexota bacterium]